MGASIVAVVRTSALLDWSLVFRQPLDVGRVLPGMVRQGAASILWSNWLIRWLDYLEADGEATASTKDDPP